MTKQLRDYQQSSVDAVLGFFDCLGEAQPKIQLTFKTTGVFLRSCVAQLATGAGKSLIVAELARHYFERTGQKVLCIQPSKELTEQNYEEFLEMTDHPASIFSGSIRKESDHDVIFGTPRSVLNEIDRYTNTFNGRDFALIVVDECHKNIQATRDLVRAMEKENPNILLLGLSATPFRTGEGFVYELDETGQRMDGSEARNPFFKQKVCEVTAPFLIENGYLTKPVWGQEDVAYDTSSLVEHNGKFTEDSIRDTFEDHGDVTRSIVEDIIEHAKFRHGVMIFGSTIAHCEEICSWLPKDQVAMVTGTTNKYQRELIIKKFKSRELKYVVNVSTLTTGFDAPHVDVVAILRPTSSINLYHQIIGRGLRLDKGKDDCLMLDYAENFERLGLERDDRKMFDVSFNIGEVSEVEEVIINCPLCDANNRVSIQARFTDDYRSGGFTLSPDGFMVGLDGFLVELDGESENGVSWAFNQFAPHSGRRCKGEHYSNLTGEFERCDFYWIYRECEVCNHQNDITARQCQKCSEQLINPSEKLTISPEGDLQRTLTEFGKENLSAFKYLKSSPDYPTSNTFRSIVVDVQREKGYPQMKVRFDNNRTVVLNFNPQWKGFYSKALSTFKELCVAVFGIEWCRENLNDRDLMDMLATVVQQWFVKGLNNGTGYQCSKTATLVQNNKGYWEMKNIGKPETVFNPEIDYKEFADELR